MGHLGNQESCEPSTSKEVLVNVKGIDLFIDGHDHKLVEEEVNGTLLVETGCYLGNIGLVVIDDGAPKNKSVAYGSYEGTDKAAQAVIDDVNEKVQAELAVVLGHTNYFLDGSKTTIRMQETNLADFFCDALMWSADKDLGKKPDCAIWNAGGMRSSIDKGDISLATIKSVAAFSNACYVFKQAAKAEAPETVGFDYEILSSYLIDACDHEVPKEYESAQGRINIVGV